MKVTNEEMLERLNELIKEIEAEENKKIPCKIYNFDYYKEKRIKS